MDPIDETVTTTTATTSPQPPTANDISFNSLTTDTESLGAAATEVDDEADSGAPGSPSPPRPPPSINSRRCPIKAGCFQRVEASIEEAKLREAALRRASKPPAAKVEDPDEPAWPPKSRHWKRYVELRTMKSSPANHVLHRDENSLSHPRSNKSEDMLPDKVADQLDGAEYTSGSESYQLVRYDKAQGENTLSLPSKKGKFTIDTYAVQCSDCHKWRVIPSKLTYEQIRENIIQVPFSCKYVHGWNPEVTCQYPTDISADDGKVWAIDIPCIPQTPLGWERKIIIRSEQGTRFADVYYISPAGRKIRSMKEVEKYLEDNPDNTAGLQISQFLFKLPKPAESSGQSKPIEPTEALSSPRGFRAQLHAGPTSRS